MHTISGSRLGRAALVAAVLCGAAAFAASAQACSKSWAAPASGAWTDATAWSPAGAPAATDDVCLPGTGTYTVTLSAVPGGGARVASITVGGAGTGAPTLLIKGASVPSGGVTQPYSALTALNGGGVAANGTLTLDTTDSGSAVLAGGSIRNDGAIVTQNEMANPLSGDDDRVMKNYLRAPVVNEPTGTLRVTTGRLWMDAGTTFQNLGTVLVEYRGAWAITTDPSLATTPSTVINSGFVDTYSTYLLAGAAWAQAGGSVTGGPIVLQNSALDYRSGTGSFEFTLDVSPIPSSLSGTIPAGQAVYIDNSVVHLVGPSVVNRGLLQLNAASISGAPYGGVTGLADAPLDNFGKLLVAGDSFAALRAPLTNEPGGVIDLTGGLLAQESGTTTTNSGTLQIGPDGSYLLTNSLAPTGLSTLVNTARGLIDLGLGESASALIRLGSGSDLAAGGSLIALADPHHKPYTGQQYPVVTGEGGERSGSFALVGGGVTPRYARNSSVTLVYGPTATPPTARRGSAFLVGACPVAGPPCATIVLRATAVEVTRSRASRGKKRRVIIHRRTIVVGRARATVRPGASKRITVTLNAAGRRLLERAHGTLAVKVTATSGNDELIRGTVAVRR